jgi:hypothetical protein
MRRERLVSARRVALGGRASTRRQLKQSGKVSAAVMRPQKRNDTPRSAAAAAQSLAHVAQRKTIAQALAQFHQ